ncbi:MAG TPA: hypothetical protein VGI81_01895 [Tepidisphaeraceae bacterium]
MFGPAPARKILWVDRGSPEGARDAAARPFSTALSDTRHWESFHARWAGAIADELNEKLLPAGDYAEEQVHVGRLEIDVAASEAESVGGARPPIGKAGGPAGAATATLPAASVWSPPAPDLLLPAVFPDSVEVLVFSGEAGPTLVAAVALVSPANKDREESRRAFVAKCAAYLQRGVGLVVVDTVTTRQANLCYDLVRFSEPGEPAGWPEATLYATAFRPVLRDQTPSIECCNRTLAIGQPLPTLPLAIDKGVVLPLDLELTYTDARRRRRIG